MTDPVSNHMTVEESRLLSAKAGQVFQPRTPISRRDFFAGRWDQITSIVDAVSEIGLHVIIYGERGVGKTSIANIIAPLLHVFDESSPLLSYNAFQGGQRTVVKVNAEAVDTFSALWKKALDLMPIQIQNNPIGFVTEPQKSTTTIANIYGNIEHLETKDIHRILSAYPGSVFVFDEFDRLADEASKPFTDLIKTLSDLAVDATIIIVGVSETIDELVQDHGSIARSLVQVPMPRMKPEELREILDKAQAQLGIDFTESASNSIVRMSQGLPHYTHLVGQCSVRSACENFSRTVEMHNVKDGLTKAVGTAHQSTRTKYTVATHSAHPDALYKHVLLACAVVAYSTTDDNGFFQASQVAKPLTKILEKPNEVAISTFNKHLTEFCEDPKRGRALERHGAARSYRYRFRDPLLPPYVIMQGLSCGMFTETQWGEMAGTIRPSD